ncbi:nucleotide exchange factor GrpE [Anaerostipes sp.]|uniref:nucleotide exchange factor GrpE n=1 Tax=Anaerostipes sp. TaxID=1872530 RepID=UPI0025C2EEBC|nr:nucleotide exchange factor GrpE [Anaerostipes sp.]MBS7009452.1 nucleotide exchange factor GrpE [Anaerostipes sp.]
MGEEKKVQEEEIKEDKKTEEQETAKDKDTKKAGRKTSKKQAAEDLMKEKDQQIGELTDKYQRLMAEFENVRKRTAKEFVQRYDMGAMGVLEKLLPVVDNFERGLQAVAEEEKDTPFVQGIEQIYKQLMGTLDELGVKAMEAEGKEFDANLHNAVMHVEDEEAGENVVVEELQKGYMYKESVLRHSMVKVAN